MNVLKLSPYIGHLYTKHNLQTYVKEESAFFFKFPLLIYLKCKNPSQIRISIGPLHFLSTTSPLPQSRIKALGNLRGREAFSHG